MYVCIYIGKILNGSEMRWNYGSKSIYLSIYLCVYGFIRNTKREK